MSRFPFTKPYKFSSIYTYAALGSFIWFGSFLRRHDLVISRWRGSVVVPLEPPALSLCFPYDSWMRLLLTISVTKASGDSVRTFELL